MRLGPLKPGFPEGDQVIGRREAVSLSGSPEPLVVAVLGAAAPKGPHPFWRFMGVSPPTRFISVYAYGPRTWPSLPSRGDRSASTLSTQLLLLL